MRNVNQLNLTPGTYHFHNGRQKMIKPKNGTCQHWRKIKIDGKWRWCYLKANGEISIYGGKKKWKN